MKSFSYALAALAAVAGGAADRKTGGFLQIRVVRDEERVVAAELENRAPEARAIRNLLSDRDATGEGESTTAGVATAVASAVAPASGVASVTGALVGAGVGLIEFWKSATV